jgi:hypothetical protein
MNHTFDIVASVIMCVMGATFALRPSYGHPSVPSSTKAAAAIIRRKDVLARLSGCAIFLIGAVRLVRLLLLR